ncbi:MAG: hypothetical protein AB8H79_26525 [Myxococcota bacterium]
MSTFPEQATLQSIVDRLKSAGWKERETIKDELLNAALSASDRVSVEEYLQSLLKTLSLELRWEVEEVIEALQPEPEPVEEPESEEGAEEESEDPGQLRMSDLDMVYDDPRGLQVYQHKTTQRWFAVQPDPQTGQPKMFELRPDEITQLKSQLHGSPYWLLGAGG